MHMLYVHCRFHYICVRRCIYIGYIYTCVFVRVCNHCMCMCVCVSIISNTVMTEWTFTHHLCPGQKVHAFKAHLNPHQLRWQLTKNHLLVRLTRSNA